MPEKAKRLNVRFFLRIAVALVVFCSMPAFAEDSRGTMDSPILPEKTMEIPQGSVQIDGKPEFQWEVLKGVSFGSGGTRVSAKLLWNKKTLYLFAVVEDSTWDGNDYAAIFIREKNGNGETDAFAFYRDARAAEGCQYVVMENDQGYAIEAAVTLRKNPIPGDAAGIDIRVANTETGIISWSGSDQAGFTAAGTGIFGKALKAAYCLYGTPAVDGEMESGLWGCHENITPNSLVQGSLARLRKVRPCGTKKPVLYALVTARLLESLRDKDSMESL